MQNIPNDPRFVSKLTKDTYALVLAGGKGSRLKNLTDWRAKPAVPFGGKFRIIDFVLSNCVNSGIRRIGVATQYKAHSLIRHLQRGWSFLDGRFKEYVDVLPASQRLDEGWYQGTADAVFQNLDILRSVDPRYVLILGGDHIYKMDYGKLLSDHVLKGADLTVACIEVPIADATAFGVMGIDDQWRVREFVEKPPQPKCVPGKPDRALASMGIYVFNAEFLYEQLEIDTGLPDSSHDFGKDLIPHLVPTANVCAHNYVESCVAVKNDVPYWRDVGTVDAYWEANLDLARVDPELNLYDQEWPIWTWQEQLPPAKFVFDEDGRRGYAVDSLVSGGCIVSGAKVARSVLFSNVRVHSYGSIEDSIVLPDVVVERDVSLRRCVVDKHCILPRGLRAGFDPVRDAGHFHVTENGITLITPDMLGQPSFHQR
ncbi:MAG: glucose-1-phosphate adenylyltransferase [Burkholderiales bacterium]